MVRSLLLLVVLSLYGCGSESVEEAKDTPEETVFDDQIQAIDKAKKVEDLVMDRKQEIDDAIEESEEE